jgi:hypothetical protein
MMTGLALLGKTFGGQLKARVAHATRGSNRTIRRRRDAGCDTAAIAALGRLGAAHFGLQGCGF